MKELSCVGDILLPKPLFRDASPGVAVVEVVPLAGKAVPPPPPVPVTAPGVIPFGEGSAPGVIPDDIAAPCP